jgi:hypothetical protein
MLRLTKEDFADPHELAKYAATAGISQDEFAKQFEYLIEEDMLYQAMNGRSPSATAAAPSTGGTGQASPGTTSGDGASASSTPPKSQGDGESKAQDDAKKKTTKRSKKAKKD